jgi:hypothetical protein
LAVNRQSESKSGSDFDNELVVEQSPAGKNVSTEAENIGSDPSPGNDW